MSSILEALRELEGSKPAAARSRAAWPGAPDEPAPAWRRAAELLGIVVVGLVVGGAGFGLVAWLGGPAEAPPAAGVAEPPAAVAPAPEPPPALAATPPAQSATPEWLARLGPPQARVGTTPDEVDRRPPTTAGRATGLTLLAVIWDDRRAARAVTLRIGGERVTLHEGEEALGVEVQLITREGAYVRRGAEVFMLEPRG